MNKIIGFVFVFLSLISVSVMARDDIALSGAAAIQQHYMAGIMGITLSEGIHLQGYVAADHDTGLFTEMWASTPSITDYQTSFQGEVDVSFGWRGKLTENIKTQIDYSVFYFKTGGKTYDLHNNRLFVNWQRKGVQPYLAVQSFYTKNFGPGENTAYKVGARYKGFNAEFGGHDGIFGTNSDFATYGRVGYSKVISGMNASFTYQASFDDLVEDKLFFSINKSF